MTSILAIDPGISGALAWVSRDGHLIEVADMPIAKIRDKNRIVAAELTRLIADRTPEYIVIEQVGPRPKEGAGAAFAFGYGAGLLEGIAAGLGIPVHMTSPATWKRRAGVPKEKDGARMMASRMWPGACGWFRRVKDDGRAEAALMARWAVLGGIQG